MLYNKYDREEERKTRRKEARSYPNKYQHAKNTVFRHCLSYLIRCTALTVLSILTRKKEEKKNMICDSSCPNFDFESLRGIDLTLCLALHYYYCLHRMKCHSIAIVILTT